MIYIAYRAQLMTSEPAEPPSPAIVILGPGPMVHDGAWTLPLA